MTHFLQLTASIVDYSSLPKAKGNTIQTVVDIVFAISASIALLMIVVSGFRYIVAHGDPGATANARKGILYAVIGLLVVMAAYSIVAFVVKGVA